MSDRALETAVERDLGRVAGIALRCQHLRDALPEDGSGLGALELLEALERALQEEGLERPPRATVADDLKTLQVAGLIERDTEEPGAFRRAGFVEEDF